MFAPKVTRFFPVSEERIQMVALTAKLIESKDGQTVQLPQGLRLPGTEVLVRRQGAGLVLEPVRPSAWPEGFFDSIRIDDPLFERPPQGDLEPIEPLDLSSSP